LGKEIAARLQKSSTPGKAHYDVVVWNASELNKSG